MNVMKFVYCIYDNNLLYCLQRTLTINGEDTDPFDHLVPIYGLADITYLRRQCISIHVCSPNLFIFITNVGICCLQGRLIILLDGPHKAGLDLKFKSSLNAQVMNHAVIGM